MDALPDRNALQRLTGAISRASPGYTTNLYVGPDQLERWCAAGRLYTLAAEGAVLILRADRDFHHVYHVARDLPALTEALLQLPAGGYTTDLVGRDNGLDPLCQAHVAAGFAARTFLCRMVRVTPTEPSPGDGVEVAASADVEAVAAFLERLLDPLIEQLPDPEELGQAARDGRLLLVREGTELAGVLMYDMQGQLAHLRFWHVDPGAQGAGIGRRLMAGFLSRCAQAQRIVLWVIGDNHRSIAIYRHYGFEVDGLLDRIMTRN